MGDLAPECAECLEDLVLVAIEWEFLCRTGPHGGACILDFDDGDIPLTFQHQTGCFVEQEHWELAGGALEHAAIDQLVDKAQHGVAWVIAEDGVGADLIVFVIEDFASARATEDICDVGGAEVQS